MRTVLQLFGSKVVLAILGALLIGGVSAGLAAGTALRPHTPAPGVASTTDATNLTSTATTASSPTAATTATPTDTPTTTPQNNPTATPNGQTTLRGTISALSATAQSFTLTGGGHSETIVTDVNTNYRGSAQTFADLQNTWTARVTAIIQPDGTTYLASVVDANPPGGD